MKIHIYAKTALLLLLIAAVSLSATALTAVPPKTKNTLHVVTSFYPVYIAALNVASGVDGVTVENMADSTAGCLHDYQMSPSDRVTLESADVFVMNGAGAEPFLDSVLSRMTTLRVIDLSAGQQLLESGHVHSHDGHDHSHEDYAVNSHLWVSPMRYRLQVETLCRELTALDPDNAARYEQNTKEYLEKVNDVWLRLQAAADAFEDTPTVLFHDSLAYLAEDLDLHVVAALNVGEDSGVSAHELSEAEDVLRGEDKAMFLYDAQYDSVQYTYLQTVPTNAVPLSVDTAVTGKNDPDAWLSAMTALCEQWEEASSGA